MPEEDRLDPTSFLALPADRKRPSDYTDSTHTTDTERPPRSTGPRTPYGKERSSKNSTKHGCTAAKTVLLPGEDREEWEQLRQGWLDDYDPGTHTSRSLVLKLAEADWFLLRNLRRYRAVEHELYEEQEDPLQWTEEQHKKLERFLRYRTTAERAFDRALRNLEQVRRTRMLDAEKRQKARERQALLELRLREHEFRLELQARQAEEKAKRDAEKEAKREREEAEKEAKRQERVAKQKPAEAKKSATSLLRA